MSTTSEAADVAGRRKRRMIVFGAAVGALAGLLIGVLLSRGLSLGERLQQLNLTNTGSGTIRAVLETRRFGGDGEVLIEPGKVGMFVYGEGDKLTLFGASGGAGHAVVLHRRPVRAEANADGDVVFAFTSQ